MSDAKAISYELALSWEGNQGEGTSSYAAYSRRFRLSAEGKPALDLTADRAFRGDPGLYNPEELLVGAIAGCHMLFFLALCARSGITVLRHSDAPTGTLRLDADGGGQFERVLLRPTVTVARGTDRVKVEALHARAASLCFIARSCNFPVEHELHVELESDERGTSCGT